MNTLRRRLMPADLVEPVEQDSEPAADIPDARRRRAGKLTAERALAAAAIDEVMDAKLRRRLRRGGPLAVVVEVPGRSWVDPIKRALSEILPNTVIDVSRTGEEKKPADSADPEVARALAAGRPVIGVAVALGDLSPVLVAGADLRLRVRIDAGVVHEAIRRAQRGHVPGVDESLVAGRDFHDLAACIRHGERPADAVRRLAALARGPAVAGGESLPDLADAIVYGPARLWGLDLARDVADVRTGRLDWSAVDRGAVLHGPPGTGKTTFARILASSCGMDLVAGSVGELFATSTGDLGAVIQAERRLFARARAAAPAILFLDELDALPSRESLSDRNRDWWLPVITDFFIQLDGTVGGRNGIVVLGATNRVEALDPALLRPGRLERTIAIPPPDAAGLAWTLRQHLGADLAGCDESLLRFAATVPGATPADAMGWVRAARRRARREDRPLALADLESEALPPDARGAAVLRRAAVHEAGHVVGFLAAGIAVRHAAIIGTKDSGGAVSHAPLPDHPDRSQIESFVVALLAGRAAEALLCGAPSAGAGGSPDSDLGRATAVVARIHGALGLGDHLTYRESFDPARDRDLAATVELHLQALAARAARLVADRRDAVDRLAAALARHRHLDEGDLAALAGPPPSRRSPSPGP